MIKRGKVYLTPEGLEKLKRELEELVGEGLLAVREELRRAKEEEPDVAENPAFMEALNRRDRVEARVTELKGILNNYELIEAVFGDSVVLGSTVVVEVEGRKDKFTIVGSLEADPMSGKISDESPVGQALLGAKPGAVIEVTGSVVRIVYKVLSIE